MNEQRNKEFLTKLKDLMTEYNADIHFDCEGDTHGISNARMIIDVNRKPVHENPSFWLEDINETSY